MAQTVISQKSRGLRFPRRTKTSSILLVLSLKRVERILESSYTTWNMKFNFKKLAFAFYTLANIFILLINETHITKRS